MGNEGKIEVAKTKISSNIMASYGKASNELFTQFVARISLEIPTATLAMFSKMKYINAPNFEKFRKVWNAEYLGGFIVHSKAFEGLKGNFPIGFLVWKTNQNTQKKVAISEIITEVLDKNAKPIGEKCFYNLPNETFLNAWIKRPRSNNTIVIPLKNCVSVYDKPVHLQNWSNEAIGYMWCDSNDFQKASTMTTLFSSVWGQGHGFYVTNENLWQSAIVFTVRRVLKHTWINDRDQFLQPTVSLHDEFKTDCLIWMLFNGNNLTASANELEWNDKKWSIVNNFIPYTENEVGATERFESDFMVQYMADKTFSDEAQEVLDAGKVLWQAYFTHTDERSLRDNLKLNRSDVGWYQIRMALQSRNIGSDYAPISFKPFENAYKILGEKLQPQVYDLGFLKA